MNEVLHYSLFAIVLFAISIFIQLKMNQKIKALGKSANMLDETKHILKHLNLFMYIALSVLVILGWFLMENFVEEEKNNLKKLSMGLAPTFANHLESLGFDEIYENTAPQTPMYSLLKDTMQKWADINPDILSIYAFRKNKEGQNYLVLDTNADLNHNGKIDSDLEKAAPLGQIYKKNIPALEEAFKGTATIEKSPTSHKWGASIGAFAPIFDSSGQVVGVLGIDFDGNKWISSLDLQRLKALVLLFVPYILINIMYLMIYYGKIENLKILLHRKELQKTQDRFLRLWEATMEGVLIHQNGRILEANPAVSELYGYSLEEIIGQHVSMFTPPDLHDILYNNIQSKEKMILEGKVFRKDGSSFPIEIIGRPCIYNDTPAHVFTIRNLTQQKRDEETIYHMAYYDDLTNLPNRKLFTHKLQAAIAKSQSNSSLAIVLLDIDQFKLINDTFGHSVGDHLLIILGERLKDQVQNQALLSRWGGDEFALLLQDFSSTDEVDAFAQRILDILRESLVLEGYEMQITASLGICLYPRDGSDYESLLKNADTALYTVKSKNRNHYAFYQAEMNNRSLEKLSLELELRKAVQNQDFVLYYQPQIDLLTGDIIGMEALVRWNHPLRGIIPPGIFIPLAEETQLIIPLGEWVLRTACEQNKAWMDAGFPPMVLSVNLSPKQFEKDNIIKSIDEILEETELPPAYLDVEITESMTMNVDRTLKIMHDLKRLGVQISIDDFGTGYSSLSYLKNFPIDRLKIDKSFVHSISSAYEPITSTIIDMAHNLNLHVIAEGVETELQLGFLQQEGCNQVQGFLFYKPVPKEEFEEILLHMPHKKYFSIDNDISQTS